MPERRAQNLADHDLLIEIKTKVEGLEKSMMSLQTNLGSRVELVEKNKVNYSDLAVIRETIERNLISTTKETDRLESVKETKESVKEIMKEVDQHQKDIDWMKSKIFMAIGAVALINIIGLSVLFSLLKY